MNRLFFLWWACKLKKSKWILWAFPSGEFGRVWSCKPLFLPVDSKGAVPEKNSVFTFLHCLKWVFQPVFSSFNNAFRFHLMTLKWDQERVFLAIYPLRTSSGWGTVKYLKYDEWKFRQLHIDWSASLKQGSLDKTDSLRHRLWHFTK